MSIPIPVFNNLPNSSMQTESQYNAAWDSTIGTFNTYGAALNALGAQVEQYALDAESAVAALPNAKWVSGTYSDGDVRWSPTDYQDYRCKGSGSRTTDPALDPTNWVPRIRTGNGGADTTSSAVDINLIATSGRLQIIAMTASNKSVYAPSASTLTKGATVFVIKNTGTYRFAFRKNGGGFIGYVNPGQVVAVHCSDTSSSAGVWQISGQDVDQVYGGNTSEVLNNVDSRYIDVAMLTSTQAICAFVNNVTTYVNAVVLNFGSASGTPAPVNGEASVNVSIAAQTSGQATVVYQTLSGVTKGYVLDISGNAFTPGTVRQIDATTGGSGTALTALSSTQLLCVYQDGSAGAPKERVLDITSSAITESGEVTADATAAASVYFRVEKISASKALIAFKDSSTSLVKLRLQSITGSTPAPTGSVLSLSAPGTTYASFFGLVVLSSTRALVVHATDRTYADMMISLIDISGTSPVLVRNKLLRVGLITSADIDSEKIDSSTVYATWTGGANLGVDAMTVKVTDDDQIITSVVADKLEASVAATSGYLSCAALDGGHVMQVCRNKDTYLSAKTLELAA